jgi:hypothetical protein
MLCSGACIYFLLRDQPHASSPAIAIASFCASLAAFGFGSYLGRAYLLFNHRLAAAFIVPSAVLLLTALVASVAYNVSIPILHMHYQDLLSVSPRALLDVPLYAVAYLLFCWPVWSVGLPLCSYYLYKSASHVT